MFEQLKLKKTELIGKVRQFIATICLGPITLGASLSWTAPVLPQLQNPNSTSSVYLTTEEGSWVGSMLAIGVLMAALPSGYLADRFGVKKMAIALLVPVLLFTLIVAFANDVYVLCFGRLLSGWATGGISVVGPMYISEISDVSLRGVLGSFFEFLIYVGVLMAVICGTYLHYVTLTIVLGIFALLLGIIFLFFPESPTYLMKGNRRDLAEKALRFYKSETYNFENALDTIYENLFKDQKKPSIRKALRSRAVVRGLIAAVGLTIVQQLSGVDGVIFYTVQIFQAAGTVLDPFISSIIVVIVEICSSIFVLFVVERAGRKVFLYMSCFGTCVCLAVVAIYFNLRINNILFEGMEVIPLVSIIVYSFVFSLGLGPVPYMMYGELFAPEVKGLAIGITITTNWTFLFIITKTLPVMMSDFGAHYTFYIYSLCMLLSLPFIKFFIPETRGKTLEEIQIKLAGTNPKIHKCMG